jgi:metal-responsive CopG/Arc/MetJ family transcriptional regulator
MPRKKSGMSKINLYIQPEVLSGIGFIAQKRGTTRSGIIREACREIVVRELQTEKEIASLGTLNATNNS